MEKPNWTKQKQNGHYKLLEPLLNNLLLLLEIEKKRTIEKVDNVKRFAENMKAQENNNKK